MGDVSWQIYPDVPPFATYDLSIYNVRKSYTANGFSINGGTGPQGTGFMLGENYVKVTGMTGALHLTVRDSINEFSIVGPDLVPEPRSLGLLLAGGWDEWEDVGQGARFVGKRREGKRMGMSGGAALTLAWGAGVAGGIGGNSRCGSGDGRKFTFPRGLAPGQ